MYIRGQFDLPRNFFVVSTTRDKRVIIINKTIILSSDTAARINGNRINGAFYADRFIYLHRMHSSCRTVQSEKKICCHAASELSIHQRQRRAKTLSEMCNALIYKEDFMKLQRLAALWSSIRPEMPES